MDVFGFLLQGLLTTHNFFQRWQACLTLFCPFPWATCGLCGELRYRIRGHLIQYEMKHTDKKLTVRRGLKPEAFIKTRARKRCSKPAEPRVEHYLYDTIYLKTVFNIAYFLTQLKFLTVECIKAGCLFNSQHILFLIVGYICCIVRGG